MHRCDLCCIGCGTNAKYVQETCLSDVHPTFEEIALVLKKIKDYSDKTHKSVFINIGGGEPFLRKDIIDVLKLASAYFSPQCVGVDTNASLPNSSKLIKDALPYINYIGISINGLENYHNWWAGNKKINPFARATSVIKELCKDDTVADKIEVTSVATTKNMKELPKLMEFLVSLGIKKYSIHRAVPVGRMAHNIAIIPNSSEYLDLLINMIKESKKFDIDFHLHHSIESIHASLLLGLNTYSQDRIGNPDASSSIGIEPSGNVVFDPWCTSGIWQQLTSGNLLSYETKLEDLLDPQNGSCLELAKYYTAPHLRCKGCPNPCSGGSRVIAAAYFLKDINLNNITDSHILEAMTEIDPACPYYDKKQ